MNAQTGGGFQNRKTPAFRRGLSRSKKKLLLVLLTGVLLAAVGTILIIVNLSAGEGTRRRNNYA